MKKLTWLVLLSFISLYAPPAFSEEQEQWDYQEVTEGEIVPFNGYLFTQDGIANSLARVQTKVNLLKLEKDEELKRVKINLESIIKTKDSELLSSREMYEKQLEVNKNAIKGYQNELMWGNVKLISAIIVSTGVGLLIGKLFIKN